MCRWSHVTGYNYSSHTHTHTHAHRQACSNSDAYRLHWSQFISGCGWRIDVPRAGRDEDK
jgi:hypothetical protein